MNVVILMSASLAMAQPQSSDELYPIKELIAKKGATKTINKNSSGIPSGNYSGIAWIGGNKYIVISDKKVNTDAENTDSWQIFSITTNEKGEPTNVSLDGTTTLKTKEGEATYRSDPEGIVFVPKANSINGADFSEGGTVFISAEGDQRVLEYDLEGRLTGRELAIPEEMGISKIHGNYGFEALTYSAERREFWTTTEQGLKADVDGVSSPTNIVPTYLRMVCFDDNLQMKKQYAYKTDTPTGKSTTSRYAFGVPELVALPDGTLIVCEREFLVGDGTGVVSSFVKIKLYRAYPEETSETAFSESLKDLPEERFMKKELLLSFTTNIANIANYEAMCLGPKLSNGSMNILLTNDSQNRYKSVLGEFILNVTLTEKEGTSGIAGNTSYSSASTMAYGINGMPIALKNSEKMGIIIENGKKFVKH